MAAPAPALALVKRRKPSPEQPAAAPVEQIDPLTLVPKSKSLYEHVADIENITDLVFALDDSSQMTPEVEEKLQHALIKAIAGNRAKVDRTAGVLASLESAEALASAEADRLSIRAATMKRNRERLQTYVLAVLEASRLDKIDGETSTLKRQKNPPKVIIDSEEDIPFDFLRFPPEPPPPPPVPDKALIKKALQAGPVSGCRLVQEFRLVRS